MAGSHVRIRIGASLDTTVDAAFASLQSKARKAGRSVASELSRGAAQGASAAVAGGRASPAEVQAKQGARAHAAAMRQIERQERDRARATEREAKRAARAEQQAFAERLRTARLAQKEQSRGERQAARERERTIRQEARAHQRAIREQARAEKQAAREKARTERQAARESERIARRASRVRERIASQERRNVERLARRAAARQARTIDRFATRTSHRATRFFWPNMPATRMVRNVATDLARGAGVELNPSRFIERNVQAEEMARQLSVQAYRPGETGAAGKRVPGAQLAESARALGEEMSASTEEILRGQKAFVDLQGDLEGARNLTREMLTLSKGQGAVFEEVMHSAGKVNAMLSEQPEYAQDTGKRLATVVELMSRITSQGKVGSITLESMAKYLSTVSGMAGRFEGPRAGTLMQLTGLAQMAEAGAAKSPAQATKWVQSFTLQLQKRAQRIQKYTGVEVTGETGMMRDPFTIIKEMLAATAGGGVAHKPGIGRVKMTQGQLIQEALGGRAQAYLGGFGKLESIFAGATGGKKDAESVRKGLAAVNEELSKWTATLSERQKLEDLAAYQKTTAAKAEQLNQKFEKIAADTLPKLTDAAEQLVPWVVKGAEAFSGLVTWAAENPWSAVSAMVGLALSRAVAESAARAMIEGIGRATLAAVGAYTGKAVGGLAANVATGAAGAAAPGLFARLGQGAGLAAGTGLGAAKAAGGAAAVGGLATLFAATGAAAGGLALAGWQGAKLSKESEAEGGIWESLKYAWEGKGAKAGSRGMPASIWEKPAQLPRAAAMSEAPAPAPMMSTFAPAPQKAAPKLDISAVSHPDAIAIRNALGGTLNVRIMNPEEVRQRPPAPAVDNMSRDVQ